MATLDSLGFGLLLSVAHHHSFRIVWRQILHVLFHESLFADVEVHLIARYWCGLPLKCRLIIRFNTAVITETLGAALGLRLANVRQLRFLDLLLRQVMFIRRRIMVMVIMAALSWTVKIFNVGLASLLLLGVHVWNSYWWQLTSIKWRRLVRLFIVLVAVSKLNVDVGVHHVGHRRPWWNTLIKHSHWCLWVLSARLRSSRKRRVPHMRREHLISNATLSYKLQEILTLRVKWPLTIKCHALHSRRSRYLSPGCWIITIYNLYDFCWGVSLTLARRS